MTVSELCRSMTAAEEAHWIAIYRDKPQKQGDDETTIRQNFEALITRQK